MPQRNIVCIIGVFGSLLFLRMVLHSYWGNFFALTIGSKTFFLRVLEFLDGPKHKSLVEFTLYVQINDFSNIQYETIISFLDSS